jgi:hypothetical protein
MFFKMRKDIRLILVLCLMGCERGTGPGIPAPSARPASPDRLPANAERPTYMKITTNEDILNAPTMDIPDPMPIPGWKRETRVKDAEFQMPEIIKPRYETSEDINALPPGVSDKNRKSTRKGFIFSDDELRVTFSIWSNMQPEELIIRNNIYQTTLIEVRKVAKPYTGFFFKYTLFGDYIFELLIKGKKDTYQFRVVRPQGGTESASTKVKLSDEELLKILFSLKLPPQ